MGPHRVGFRGHGARTPGPGPARPSGNPSRFCEGGKFRSGAPAQPPRSYHPHGAGRGVPCGPPLPPRPPCPDAAGTAAAWAVVAAVTLAVAVVVAATVAVVTPAAVVTFGRAGSTGKGDRILPAPLHRASREGHRPRGVSEPGARCPDAGPHRVPLHPPPMGSTCQAERERGQMGSRCWDPCPMCLAGLCGASCREGPGLNSGKRDCWRPQGSSRPSPPTPLTREPQLIEFTAPQEDTGAAKAKVTLPKGTLLTQRQPRPGPGLL